MTTIRVKFKSGVNTYKWIYDDLFLSQINEIAEIVKSI